MRRSILTRKITIQKTPMNIPILRLGAQYWMMRPDAVSSNAKVIAQENQYIHP